MSYKDKYGITEIRSQANHKYDILDISYDDDCEGQRRAMFLHIPDPKGEDHNHIELSQAEARILYEWLGEFLKEVENA